MQALERGFESLTFDNRFTEPARIWLASIYAKTEQGPALQLVDLLEPKTLVQIVNQANAFIQTASYVVAQDGSVCQSDKHDSTRSDHQARCTLFIYYRVLQGVLSSCSSTSNQSNNLTNTKAAELALNSTFQHALLLCALELTSFCIAGNASFPAITTKLGHCSAALDLWEATGHFLCHLSAEPGLGLPNSVSSYLLFIRVRITEQLAWKASSSIYQAICEGGGGSNISGNYRLLSTFLDSVNDLATSRTHATASVIAAGFVSQGKKSSFVDDSHWLIRLVLDQHLDLLFGQHLSNIVACCIYSIVRVHHGAVSFKKIVDSMLQIFPHHRLEDFKQAEVQQATAESEAIFGNTRQLYNVLFLPRVEQALYDRFPDMQSSQNNLSSQDDGEDLKAAKTAANKQEVKARRPPLHNLSATDLNVRAGKFRKMQG